VYQVGKETKYLQMMHGQPSIKISKAIPLQAWTDPEGSRRLRLTDFMTIDT